MEIIEQKQKEETNRLFDSFLLGSLLGGAIILAPKLASTRALFFGFRSLLNRPKPKSLHSAEVESIRYHVHTTLNGPNEQYLVVRGPEGIGKTLAIQTALAHTWGVVYTRTGIDAGTSQRLIERIVESEISNKPISPYRYFNVKRIVMWSKFFSFFFTGRVRKLVIVIPLKSYRGQIHESYPNVGEIARNLSIMGMRVVVDAPENALPCEPQTNRELSLEIEPAPFEKITQIDELKGLIEFLKRQNLYNEVNNGYEIRLYFRYYFILILIKLKAVVILGSRVKKWLSLSRDWKRALKAKQDEK